MDRHKVLRDVHRRHTYKSDGKGNRNNWTIHRDGEPFEGDCEDFALTLLYELAGRSMTRFWWLQTSGQAVLWHVKTRSGAGHCVLWYKGLWADNTQRTWYTTDAMPHTRKFPYLVPAVVAKLALR